MKQINYHDKDFTKCFRFYNAGIHKLKCNFNKYCNGKNK